MALKAMLDSPNGGLQGIGVDHYQYIHCKRHFPEPRYKIVLHSSNAVLVGLMISSSTNGTLAADGSIVHKSNPIVKCLTRHAMLERMTIGEQIISSLNHTHNLHQKPKGTSTINTFFGEEIIYGLIASGLILSLIIITYGIIDHLKNKKRKQAQKKLDEKISNTKDENHDLNSESVHLEFHSNKNAVYLDMDCSKKMES